MARFLLARSEDMRVTDVPYKTGGQSFEEAPLDREPEGSSRTAHRALAFLACLGLILLLHHAREVFLPIVAAILASYSLEPIVGALARLRVPRLLGAGLVLATLAGALAFGAYALSDGIVGLVDELPRAAQNLRQSIQSRSGSTPGAVAKMQAAATEIQKTASAAAGPERTPSGALRVHVVQPPFKATELLWSGSMGALSFLVEVVMIAFLTYFLLISRDRFKRRLVAVLGSYRTRVTGETLDEINGRIERFLLAMLLAMAVKGVTTALVMAWIGLEHPAVWGLVAGLLTPIPYFGAAAVVAGSSVVALLQFGSVSMAAWVAGVNIAIAALEGWLLVPVLMGRAARMNQVGILAGLIFWTWVWGLWGLMLAVPMMMVVKTVCDRVEGFQPIGTLLGDD
jgi:predicted PurR-regulated permease PerM